MKRAGVECDELVQNIDFAPTYLAVAGIEKSKEMPGRSLMEIGDDGKAPKDWRESIYYHYYDYPAIHMVRRHDGVATDRYKLIHFYGENKDKSGEIDSWEFYDLKSDPSEMCNQYSNPKYIKEIEKLKVELQSYRDELKVKEY